MCFSSFPWSVIKNVDNVMSKLGHVNERTLIRKVPPKEYVFATYREKIVEKKDKLWFYIVFII